MATVAAKPSTNCADGEVYVEEQAAKDVALKAKQLARKKDSTLKDKGKYKEKERERAAKSSRKAIAGQAEDIPISSSKRPSGVMVPATSEGSKRKLVDGDVRADATKKLRSSSAPMELDHSLSFQYPVIGVHFTNDREATAHLFRKIGGPSCGIPP